MRLINGKISAYNNLPLRAPDDNGGSNGGTQQTGGGQESQEGNQGNKGSKELDLESESLVEDLLGSDDDDDDSELDFGSEEEEDDDPEETARISQSTKTLGEMLNAKIGGIGLKAEDIPADFDASDSAQVAKLLTQTNQALAKEVISVVPEILKHALGIIVPKLEKKIQTASVSTNKKSEQTKAFNGLGLKGADKTLGVSIYKRALAQGMNPEKAAKATQKALAQLRGGSGNGFNTNNNRNNVNGNGSGVKVGKSALDSMFGSS